jgi:hypothetical protein
MPGAWRITRSMSFVEDGLRQFDATTTPRTATGGVRQIGQGPDSGDGRAPDGSFGHSIAKADVHTELLWTPRGNGNLNENGCQLTLIKAHSPSSATIRVPLAVDGEDSGRDPASRQRPRRKSPALPRYPRVPA